MDKTFSLKDHLFNKQKVRFIAQEIRRVYPSFDSTSFVSGTMEKFPQLELKERIKWIREQLHMFLP